MPWNSTAKTLLDRETITGEEMLEVIKNGFLDISESEEKKDKPPRRRSKQNSENQ